jgi:hypothetical protein
MRKKGISIQQRKDLLIGRGAKATVPDRLVTVDAGIDADSHGAIGSNVVLIGAVLTALGSDALQLLLSRSVGIANLHGEAITLNGLAVELLDDLLANVTRLKARRKLLARGVTYAVGTYRAKPTPRLLPMLSRRILLDKMT